jgi:hypothetical protein
MQEALKVGRVTHSTSDGGDSGGASQFGNPRVALLDGRRVGVDLGAVAATKDNAELHLLRLRIKHCNKWCCERPDKTGKQT